MDLSRGESFGFLGFDFRRVRSPGAGGRSIRRSREAHGVAAELKEIFRRFRSQPVEELIAEINPKLRGWVNYFAVGHASRCFANIKAVGRAEGTAPSDAGRKRRGFGWKRWSRRGSTPRSGCSETTKSVAAGPKALLAIGLITHDTKRPGEPGAGNRHAGFEVAGAGNVTKVEL